MEALALDVFDDELPQVVRLVALDEPDPQRGDRRVGDDVPGQRAGVAARDTADVERREEDPLGQRLRFSLGPRQPQFPLERFVDRRHRLQRRPLLRPQRFDRVVPAVHQHPARVLLHGGEEPGQDVPGVGRPVPVVAGVEIARGPVDRDLHPHGPANPERQLRTAALVRGPIEEEPHVDIRDPVRRHLHVLTQMTRARFLLAVEEEDEVGRGLHAFFPERAQDGQDCGDRRLVVTGRAGVQPPLRVHRIPRLGHGARRPAGLHRRGVERGFERGVRPVRGVDGLAVVVDVDAEGPLRVRHPEFAEHEGRDAIDPEEFRGDADRA